ncbi:MAG TPA: cellulase family glycosylhydrolase [Ktedonobacteraceae bacterium]|nr:cellulase family glycosylhydrolase [Ktedonobacteraceae bacterium]
MRRSFKVIFASIILLAIVAMGVVWYIPRGFSNAQDNANGVRPAVTQANGPYTVSGNKILDAQGHAYLFHGIGRDSLEYECNTDGYFDSTHLSYMGFGHNGGGVTYWDANTVRLPLSEGYWLRDFPAKHCVASQYRALVKNIVDTLTKMNLNVMIDLQWTDAGAKAPGGGAGFEMPDADSVTFWTQVAGIFASYPNVLFELYNEPHPALGDWACWQSGCAISNDKSYVVDCNCYITASYTGVGMQTLVSAVRGAGASNLVLVAGMDWGYDLSGIVKNPITGANVIYDTHPYPYSEKMPNSWDAAFGNISKTYPVISAENGEYDCGTSYMSRLLAYFDAHSISWIGWAWVVNNAACGYPQLVTSYNGTPAPNMGVLIYQYLTSYANGTLLPGPISSTWYFAEGKVGQGFTEWLTIQNPDPVNACSVRIQYLLTTGTVTVTRTVSPKSRYTASVNSDLGTPTGSSSYKTDSIIVTVTNQTTCFGVVAERPLYFTNFFGESSGSVVMGTTTPSKTFYFADMPTVKGSDSFITILNPPGGSTATVTAKYYAGGVQVGSTQTTSVSGGRRQTINPPPISQRVIAIVTSTQPVVVERPTYFSTFPGGSVGNVSGAASVIGALSSANEWLFAEGHSGSGFQEYFVIGNPDPANTASVTIKLETASGTQSFSAIVAPRSQLIWDVNAHSNADASADINSPTAGIVVEREIFFHYVGQGMSATGATDITGAVAPPASRSESFAEGYTNKGFNEWLSLFNPTGSNETVTVTIVNGYGTVYSYNISVPGNSRAVSDITTIVSQHLYNGSQSQGYNISMTAQSSGYFIAERTMYWNVSGTQGGSDDIGYTGL